MFDTDPFSRASGFRSRAGFSGFPSHIENEFLGDRRSPVQKPFFRHSDDCSTRRGDEHRSSPGRTASPVTTSQPPEEPVAAEVTPLPPPDEPKHSVPIVVEPAVSEDVPMANETNEAQNDVTDSSLHVEEPPRRPRSPSPAPPNMTPLEIIEQVLAEGAQLKEEVEVYSGGRKEKPYLRLEELLTRLMLKLDRIESEGRDDIRSARREAVHAIQSTLELLESRTSATVAKKDLPSAESSSVPEHSSSDVSDAVSETNAETSCANDSPGDGGEQTKGNVDVAAVKEMVLGSEVPC